MLSSTTSSTAVICEASAIREVTGVPVPSRSSGLSRDESTVLLFFSSASLSARALTAPSTKSMQSARIRVNSFFMSVSPHRIDFPGLAPGSAKKPPAFRQTDIMAKQPSRLFGFASCSTSGSGRNADSFQVI